ncbi:MAG TPA: DNA-binding protein [Candidatus Corynebacterium gallistercoris]|uniref:DNA-binding protein n=1 Tax=Candidatus Corynebacterium gallistercoris TaxID=2838530 RepID=A0A9D1RZU2_9CORY|nr:DNA-binding protein [Candidatus Corynebacterium gallistercoris]
MFAIHASYRGRSKRRAEYVRSVADALAASAAVDAVELKGVEDFVCLTTGAEQAGGLVLSLLQAGDFAIGIGATIGSAQLALQDDEDESSGEAMAAATRAVKATHKAGTVAVRIEKAGPGGVLAPGKAAEITEDIHAAFTLLAHVLARRTKEGREATALMRAGYLQSEAAAEVGISKQAMSQRLAAAGWYAEQAGWGLAIRMLARVDELRVD